MAFWGVEVKPGKPHSHEQLLTTRRRLHISQATLGIGSSSSKSLLQCNVGDKTPILLCSLIPDKTESSSLHLEFEEEEVVIFSVLGPRSIHLSGYYLDKSSHTIDNGDETDSYGEDIGETESEPDNDMEDDDYEDDFIDDADIGVNPPSPRPNSGVEETSDDEESAHGNGNHRRLKKKYHVSDSDSDDSKQIVVKRGTSIFDLESEDEDNSQLSSGLRTKDYDSRPTTVKGGTSIFDSDSEDDESLSSLKAKDRNTEAKEHYDKTVLMGSKKKRAEDDGDQITGGNSKIEEVPDSETERVIELRNDSTFSLEVAHGKDEKPTKKKKRRAKVAQTDGDGDDGMTDVLKEDNSYFEEAKADDIAQEEPIRDEIINKPSHDKGLAHPDISSVLSSEARHENDEKPKKKKKRRAKEGQTGGVGDDGMIDVLKEDKSHFEEAKTDDITREEPMRDEIIDKPSHDKGLEHPGSSSSLPSEARRENDEKLKKKRKKRAKEGQTAAVGDDSMTDVLEEDKFQNEEAKIDEITREEPIGDDIIDKPSHDKGLKHPDDSALLPSEVRHENDETLKKKKKRAKEGQIGGFGDDGMTDVLKEDKSHIEEAKTDEITQEEPIGDKIIDKLSHEKGLEHPDVSSLLFSEARHENVENLKKKKKKRPKKGETGGVRDDGMTDVLKEDKSHIEEAKNDVTTREESIGDETIDKPSHDKGLGHPGDSSLLSSKVRLENDEKSKNKKMKRAKEVQTAGVRDDGMTDVLKEDKSQIEEAKTVDITQEESSGDENIDKPSHDKGLEHPNDSSLLSSEVRHENDEKLYKKKERAKRGQTGVVENDSVVDAPRNDKSQLQEAMTDAITQEELTKDDVIDNPSISNTSLEVESDLVADKRKRKRHQSEQNANTKESKEVSYDIDANQVADGDTSEGKKMKKKKIKNRTLE